MRYDYKCPKCGIMEISHSMNVSLTECPTCGNSIEKCFNSIFNIIKAGRPVYAYNDVLKYKTCKNEQEARRNVDKKSDGHRGTNRIW